MIRYHDQASLQKEKFIWGLEFQRFRIHDHLWGTWQKACSGTLTKNLSGAVAKSLHLDS